MRKRKYFLSTIFVATIILLLSGSTNAQTPLDTVKTGHPNDPMTVNPGKVHDPMAVIPENPHDGMSVTSDTAFLRKNIMDNRMEIQLSKVGQTKGSSPLVKKVAALMLIDHTAILKELVKLSAGKLTDAENDHNERTSPATHFPTGKEFDQAWAGQMLQMHEAKIAELETFLTLAKDAALKAAVMKAIPKIKAHRELLLKIPGAKEKANRSHTI